MTWQAEDPRACLAADAFLDTLIDARGLAPLLKLLQASRAVEGRLGDVRPPPDFAAVPASAPESAQ